MRCYILKITKKKKKLLLCSRVRDIIYFVKASDLTSNLSLGISTDFAVVKKEKKTLNKKTFIIKILRLIYNIFKWKVSN